MNTLRKAHMNESCEILKFYQKIISDIKGSEFMPKWSESYPNLEYIEDSILKGELYVNSKGSIAACAVLNNEFGHDYSNVKWHVNAKLEEIVVIHTFAVGLIGKGMGKDIFDYILKEAKKNNKKTIRIDVIDGNVGALKVFEKWGFKYVNSLKAFNESVGLQTFHLYERLLK